MASKRERRKKKKRSHRSTKHTLALFFFSFFTSVEKEDEKPKAVFMYIWNCIYEQALKTVNMFKKKKKEEGTLTPATFKLSFFYFFLSFLYLHSNEGMRA